jgi:hypothetical protein
MTRIWQRASLFAFASTIAGTVWAQPEPAQPEQPPPTTMPRGAPEGGAPTLPESQPPSTSYSMAPPPPAPTYYDQPPPPKHEMTDAGRLMFGFAWDFGIPIGSVHNYTANVSALGFDLRFRYWLNERVTLGLDADWQTLTDERDRTTYEIANGAVTARAHNSAQTGAIRAAAEFYFLEESVARPFIGANVGFGWTNFRTNAADLVYADTKESVVLGGELGGLFTFSRQAPRLLVAGRYSYQPSADFLNVTNVQTIALMVGLASP